MSALRAAVIFLVLVAAGLIVGFFGLGFWLSPQNHLQRSDAIVAVSGGETQSRALEAVKLYKQGYAPIIVFSGAAQDTSGPSNAAAMRRLAMDSGVPSDSIEVEEKSQNTAENAEDTAPLVRSLNAGSIILVTSPYHQRRASIEFGRVLGSQVKIINHSAPDQTWRRSHWRATPYSFALTVSELQKALYVLTTKQST
jgi:uncharacterized SAM-binding protein YcdF (DUF218 family)